MKRTLSILLVLLLTMLVMTSCSVLDQLLAWTDPACEHVYEATVTDPTCTSTGYVTYTCKYCQESYVAGETAMTEHEFKDGVCSCGATDPNYVPPHEHSFVDGKCECGETDPNYVPPHEHNFVEGKCECGEYDHEHEFEENVFFHPELEAATCTAPGVAVFECKICDYYYTEATPIDPEAHGFWGDREVLVEANCQTQTNGLEKVYCANGCGNFEEVEVLYSEVHAWDVQTEIYATCTSDGEYYAVCTLCGEIESYDIPAEGHWSWFVLCGETGECMGCGEEFTKEHNTVWTPATCTEAAYCMNCYSYVGEPLGHDYVADVTEPTCTTTGYTTFTCSLCSDSYVGNETAVAAHNDADGDFLCDGCSLELIPDTHEKVSYSLNISDLTAGTLGADSINGVFTIVSGSEIRNRNKTYDGVDYSKSVKIGNSATKIKVAVPGNGKLSFLVQNGSSGVDMQFITVTAPDGTVYDFEFEAAVGGNAVVKIELNVTEGEWVISRGKNGGTQDIFALALSCVVEKSDENGFALVADGKINYLVGEALDFSGVRLNATFSNGKTEPLALDLVTVDSSAVNTAESGTYPVVISYKDYESVTFYVSIYAPESIELGFDAIEKIANNSYGNGVYYNHSFRELYFVGEELDLSGLTVTVVAKCGDNTLKFIVDDYTVSGFDSSCADFNPLTVEAHGLSTTVMVSVTDAVPTPDENGVYQLLVDPAYEGLPSMLSGPYHVFATIQEALEYAAKIDANAVKVLNIAPGYYNEKLEITVPNLNIVGFGDTPDEVVIEWNSIYGLPDASGFSHVTDSTATVAVRESAYNVTIENVTISNYWNSQQRMDDAGIEIERALALLVQADRFVMKNSKLLGIQDTLELFTGRQYFENVFISGYTDFIFGTNNTTLFKNCTIHVIDTAKDDKGTAGYITAFKGSNKGATDSIVYGAIFDGCKFTADAGVMSGCTAIGRTWGAYAAVAVINSELGGHISLAGYSTNKNERYVSMNGKPTDSTCQFVEFNNTGAGALTEAVAGMRFLTADEAALYTNMAVIFGTINGNVSYLDAWYPGTAPTVDDREYYYFNGTEGTSGTSHTFDTATTIAKGTTLEWAGLLISAENGNVAWNSNANALNMKAGAFIKFNVPAGSTVTVVTYPNYNYFTLNGVGTSSSDMLTQYYAEDTEVVLLSTGDLYLYSIIINPGEEAPEAPALTEIKVSGVSTNYNVGDELALEGAVVKAYFSDNSVLTLTDYTVDASAVNNAAAGTYDLVFSYGGKSVTLTVTFAGADAPVDFTVTFGSEGNYMNSGIDFSNIQIGDNGGNNSQVKNGYFSFDVKAGAVVTINGYSGYTSYTLGDGSVTTPEITDATYVYVAEADVTITITPVSGNNYFYSFSVTYPVVEEPVDFTVTFGSEGNYKDSGIDFSNIQIGDNGGNNSQVKEGSFSFNVKAGAVVTINGYPGYTSYTLGDGTMTTEEITAEVYIYTATADVTITITPVSGNNYFYSFSVTYSATPEVPVEPDEPTPDEPTPDEPTPEEPAEPVIYVFDATADLAACAKGDKADGEIETTGTDGFFTVHYSKNTKVDGSNKTFEDGYSATQRLNFGGKTVIGSTIKNALEFTTDGPVTITIWWVKNGDSARPVEILDANGNVVASDPGEGASNSLWITTLEITEAGTYYLGGLTNNNYYFKVQVETAA